MNSIKILFRRIKVFFIHLIQLFGYFKYRWNSDYEYLINIMIYKLKLMIKSFEENSQEVRTDLQVKIRNMHRCIMNLKRLKHYASANIPNSLFYSMLNVRDENGDLVLSKYVCEGFNNAFNEFMKAFKNFPGFWY